MHDIKYLYSGVWSWFSGEIGHSFTFVIHSSTESNRKMWRWVNCLYFSMKVQAIYWSWISHDLRFVLTFIMFCSTYLHLQADHDMQTKFCNIFENWAGEQACLGQCSINANNSSEVGNNQTLAAVFEKGSIYIHL